MQKAVMVIIRRLMAQQVPVGSCLTESLVAFFFPSHDGQRQGTVGEFFFDSPDDLCHSLIIKIRNLLLPAGQRSEIPVHSPLRQHSRISSPVRR